LRGALKKAAAIDGLFKGLDVVLRAAGFLALSAGGVAAKPCAACRVWRNLA